MELIFKLRRLGLGMALASLGWLAGPSLAFADAAGNEAKTTGKAMTEIILAREDRGASLEILVGSEIAVRLEESPTTGYVWVNKTAGDVLTLLDSEFAPAAPGLIGGSGLRTLKFTVAKPGSAILSLKRMREWEGETSALEDFSVTVRAVAP